MSKYIFGTIAILIGSIGIIQREKWAREAIEFQNRTFGFHFGERDIKSSVWAYLIIGTFFIMIGLAAILGVVPVKF